VAADLAGGRNLRTLETKRRLQRWATGAARRQRSALREVDGQL